MFIRTEKNKDYSVINNTCFRDPKLSARAKGIFAYLMTLPNNWELKKYELCNHFAEGRKALDTAFKELELAGYVSKKARQVEKGIFQGWDYTIHEIPINTNETDLPGMDESVNGLSDEGEVLLNTNIPNTELINTKRESTSPLPPKKKFIPPEYAEVFEYMLERKLHPQVASSGALAFIDHHETRGWIPKGHKTQMKSWKAAVRTWIRHMAQFGEPPNTTQKSSAARPTSYTEAPSNPEIPKDTHYHPSEEETARNVSEMSRRGAEFLEKADQTAKEEI